MQSQAIKNIINRSRLCRHIKIQTLLILFVSILFSNSALACKCLPSLFTQIADEAAQAKYIFTGTPIASEPVATNSVVTVFKIKENLKGTAQAFATVTSEKDTDACGITFEKSQKYLVFVNYDSTTDKYTAHACNGSVAASSPFYEKRLKQLANAKK